MVRPSRERIQQLSRDIFHALTRSRSVHFLKDRDAVLQAISHALTDEFRREEEREEAARRRIAAMEKPPVRGTAEYDLLFVKLIEEEHVREGLDS
ncbi:MAG TPA: DUF507 family protein [Thermoanaerobaculia bacterium]|jgi:hypothetical protein